VVVIIGKRVRVDVHLVDKHLPVFYPRIGIFKIDPTLTQRFYFSPSENQPGFENIFDLVIMTGLAVFSYYFLPLSQKYFLAVISGRIYFEKDFAETYSV
jgi:hypothetical protein